MTENINENNDNKLDEITYLPPKSGTKIVYLIAAEGVSAKSKKRMFVSAKITEKAGIGVDFIGYEVPTNVINIQSEVDALEWANKGSRELYSVLFPWHKIISIRNVSYKLKQ